MKALLLFSLGWLTLMSAVHAKDFVNLNFDDGALPSTPDKELLPIEMVLPGWTARMGDHVLTEVGWNLIYSENGVVSVMERFNTPRIIEGRYGISLIGGAELGSTSPIVPASISQVGLIPADASALTFRGLIGGGSVTEVRVAGHPLPLVYLSGPEDQTLWGVDVRSFAGQEAELSFINYANPRFGIGGSVIDSLKFTSQIVPEPSTWALALVGGLALWFVGRRRP